MVFYFYNQFGYTTFWKQTQYFRQNIPCTLRDYHPLQLNLNLHTCKQESKLVPLYHLSSSYLIQQSEICAQVEAPTQWFVHIPSHRFSGTFTRSAPLGVPNRFKSYLIIVWLLFYLHLSNVAWDEVLQRVLSNSIVKLILPVSVTFACVTGLSTTVKLASLFYFTP